MGDVIVRKLSETSTHESVGRAFGEVFGPVKRVDVIRGRGFGFVKFADPADAKKAIRASRSRGVLIDGAEVTIDVARAKEPKVKKHEVSIDKELPRKPVRKNCVRLIGVPETTSQKQLYKRMRKISDFHAVLALDVVEFTSKEAARKAAEKLDGSQFRGAQCRNKLIILVETKKFLNFF